jgi:sporulation protein YlmC with PRC-barrel domain
MRLSAILGIPVQDESGQPLGHVHDVRGKLTASGLRVTGLVVGERGIVERLGIGKPATTGRLRTSDVIPWTDLLRIDRRGAVVKSRSG